ncbi:hypothetical protein GQ42DRAFT_165055 [Ramicandelaber brevisporus]|nr:hypothetical protein GQ42DRAFT_165055 [Ramicandelaber brevisporus]
MSSLAGQLQADLVALSTEARRKFPEIKDACERVLANLRQHKSKTASELAAELSSSQQVADETLKPFFLACDTRVPKLASIAVSLIQRLTAHTAIPIKSVEKVVRALQNVLPLATDIQLRTLQALLPLVTLYDSLHGDVVADIVALCLNLQQQTAQSMQSGGAAGGGGSGSAAAGGMTAIVHGTASATCRQIVAHIFDKVSAEDRLLHESWNDQPKASTASDGSAFDSEEERNYAAAFVPRDNQRPMRCVEAMLPSLQDAYMLLNDLCLLTDGEVNVATFLTSVPSLAAKDGLELIESVIANHYGLFIKHSELADLLRKNLCPSIIKQFSVIRSDYAHAVRLVRLALLLIERLHGIMTTECEVFLQLLTKLAEPDNLPWQRTLALEAFKSICTNVSLSRALFKLYDFKSSASAGRTTPPATPKSSAAAMSHQPGTPTTPSRSSTPNSRNISPPMAIRDMVAAIGRLASERPSMVRGSSFGSSSSPLASSNTSSSAAAPSVREPSILSGREGTFSIRSGISALLPIGSSRQESSPQSLGAALSSSDSSGESGSSADSIVSVTGSRMRIQCLDQLDKSDPPTVSETYLFYLSHICLTALAEGLAMCILPQATETVEVDPSSFATAGADQSANKSTLPPAYSLHRLRTSFVDGTSDTHPDDLPRYSLHLSRAMADTVWPGLYAAFSFYLNVSLDDDLFIATLRAYQQMTAVCGAVGHVEARNAFLTTLCRHIFPSGSSPHASAAQQQQHQQHQQQQVSGSGVGGALIMPSLQQAAPFTQRSIACFRVLLGLAQYLASVLGPMWFLTVAAVQQTDELMNSASLTKQTTAIIPVYQDSNSYDVVCAGTGNPLLFSPLRTPVSTGIATALGSSAITATSPPSTVTTTPLQDYRDTVHCIRQFLAHSRFMQLSAFIWLCRALCLLSADLASGMPARIDSDLILNADFISQMRSRSSIIPRRLPLFSSSSSSSSSNSASDSMITEGRSSFAIEVIRALTIDNLPLVITADSNSGSNGNSSVWTLVVDHLLDVATFANTPMSLRMMSCEAITDVVIHAIEYLHHRGDYQADAEAREIQRKVLRPLSFLVIVPEQSESSDITSTTASATGTTGTTGTNPVVIPRIRVPDVQRAALNALHSVLETAGHSITRGWNAIFDVIEGVCETSSLVYSESTSTASTNESASSGLTMINLVKFAFPSLQLICTDFLPTLPPSSVRRCIVCLANYTRQHGDLNIALTATGLIWNVCGFLQKKRMLPSSSLSVPNSVNGHDSSSPRSVSIAQLIDAASAQDGEATERPDFQAVTAKCIQELLSIDLADDPDADSEADANAAESSAATTTATTVFDPTTLSTLWLMVFTQLSLLATDSRAEVRHSANQTLFRTLDVHGDGIDASTWAEVVWRALLPMLREISAQQRLCFSLISAQPSARSGFSSYEKHPWTETFTISFTGAAKLLRDRLPVLVQAPLFVEAWGLLWGLIVDSVALAVDAAAAGVEAGSSTKDIVVCAVNALVSILSQSSSATGGAIEVELQKSLWRIAFNSWTDIGAIVARTGKLRALSSAAITAQDPTVSAAGQFIVGTAFSQETLTQLVRVFVDIYRVIESTFTADDLHIALVSIRAALLFPHAPIYTSDVDRMTPLQTAVLDAIAAVDADSTVEKLSLQPVSDQQKEPPLSIIINTLVDFMLLPYVVAAQAPGMAETLDQSREPPALLRLRETLNDELAAMQITPMSSLGLTRTSLSSVSTRRHYTATFVAFAHKATEAATLMFVSGKHDEDSQSPDAAAADVRLFEAGVFDRLVDGIGVAIVLRDQRSRIPVASSMLASHSSQQQQQTMEPMWQSAARLFMQLVPNGLDRMRSIEARLVADAILSVWNTVARVLAEIALSPPAASSNSSSSNSKSLSQKSGSSSVAVTAADEAFDMDFFATVMPALLRHVGESRAVSLEQRTDMTRALVGILRSGAALLNEHLTMNSTTANGSAQLSFGSHVHMSTSGPVREHFAFMCLNWLFALAASDFDAQSGLPSLHMTDRISRVFGSESSIPSLLRAAAAPVLVEHCSSIIAAYMHDQNHVYGRTPFPRMRTEEVTYVLRQLTAIKIAECHLVDDKDSSTVPSGAFLVKLYPVLCDAILVFDYSVLVLVQKCLQRIGRYISSSSSSSSSSH